MAYRTPHTVSFVPAVDAAPVLRQHVVTLRRNLRNGRIPGVKVGGRWFVSSAVLDRILSDPADDPCESR